LFRARLLGVAVPHQSTNTEIVPGFDELERRIVASNSWFAGYVEALAPEHLAGAPRPADTYTVFAHAEQPSRRDAA
jgi:hypothetical protein